jgi:hypothetical protein
VKVHRT